ncbi:signal peptidase II [Agaribacterium haliotis]|uniref:signal peptidase II n=1 Tax=Agaribacterium haliotis TaxID=2013869 RepID=UPI000BB573F3|nr:signal peptidase II [Agaribacterium haliotis]
MPKHADAKTQASASAAGPGLSLSQPSPALHKYLPWLWFVIALIIILLDQWTKHLAVAGLEYAERIAVTPGFNITLRYNYGVAFSIFDNIDGGQRWPLSALAFVISIALCIWIWRIGRQKSLEVLGLALVLGGAIGNLYDRVLLGYVVDFIEVYWRSYYWPAFNIADSAICVGAALLLIDGLFLSKSAKS